MASEPHQKAASVRRTPEAQAKHAAFARKYRAQKRTDRDVALIALGQYAAELRQRHGYTLGQLIDLIATTDDFVEPESDGL